MVLGFGSGAARSQEREKAPRQHVVHRLIPRAFWIAQEQGIFARNGVDVELITMQSTLSTTALLAAKST